MQFWLRIDSVNFSIILLNANCESDVIASASSNIIILNFGMSSYSFTDDIAKFFILSLTSFVLFGLQASVLKMIEIAQLDRVLIICSTKEEALSSLE